MKKIILSVFTGLLIVSCGVTKKTSTSDKSEGIKTVEERVVTRPGDTLTIDIPNIRYKDTIIERIDYINKSVARVTYDDQGNQKFDCLQAEIKEEFRLMREEYKNDVETETEKEFEFKPQYFIYAIAFLVLIMIIAMVVGVVMLSKVQKAIPGIVAKTIKDI